MSLKCLLVLTRLFIYSFKQSIIYTTSDHWVPIYVVGAKLSTADAVRRMRDMVPSINIINLKI